MQRKLRTGFKTMDRLRLGHQQTICELFSNTSKIGSRVHAANQASLSPRNRHKKIKPIATFLGHFKWLEMLTKLGIRVAS
jgi:hypothetical protein